MGGDQLLELMPGLGHRTRRWLDAVSGAAGFLAAGFLAAGFLAAGFLAAGFLAAGFLAVAILHAPSAASAQVRSAPARTAQTPSDPRLVEARQHYDQGVLHYEDQRYVLAAQSFRRSYDLMHEARFPTAGVVLYNIGTSLDEIPGREREARDAYAQYLREAPSDHELLERRSIVNARIAELSARLEIGEESAGSTGRQSTVSPTGPVIAAVGGLALLGGVIVGGLALDANSAADEGCVDGVCPVENAPRADEAELMANVADGLLFGGAAIAATGLVLTLLLRDEAEAPVVSAGCSSTGCGLTIRGAF